MMHAVVPRFLIALALLGIGDAHAQTATVMESAKQSQSYTFSNASGFSIANNGTLHYSEPLNQLTGSPCCASATLTVDGANTTISPSMFEADTGLKAQDKGGNTLSSQLVGAVIQPQPGLNQLSLQYDVVVGGVTRVATSNSFSVQNKVDGQSISVFSQFQPSVFP